MASLSPVFLFLVLFSCFTLHFVTCNDFLVGGDNGWGVPKSKKEGQMYNHWASNNRFRVNDTLFFKYMKDSVLVVNEEEYKKCHSAHPYFFSNNGETAFTLDRPGLFFFISGVSGHCERGQKMIIKVLETEKETPASSNDEPSKNNGDLQNAALTSTIILLLCLSLLGI